MRSDENVIAELECLTGSVVQSQGWEKIIDPAAMDAERQPLPWLNAEALHAQRKQ